MRTPLLLFAAVSTSLALMAGPVGADGAPVLAVTPADRAVGLSWNPVAGADGYRVLRSGSPVATVPAGTTRYTDAALSNNTTLAYTVEALVAGSTRPAAGAVRATPVDLTAPAPMTSLNVEVLDGGVEVEWWADYDAATDQGEYRFYLNGELVGVQASTATWGAFSVGGLVRGATHWLETEVVDRARNASVRRGTARFVVVDTEPPAMPIGLRADWCSSGEVRLHWDTLGGASGDVATRYDIYRNNALLDSTTAAAYTATGLVPGVPARFTVAAVDADRNASPHSVALDVTTLAKGTCTLSTPPAAPVPPAPTLYSATHQAARRIDSMLGAAPNRGTAVHLNPVEDGQTRRYAGYRLLVDGAVVRTGALPGYGLPVAVPLNGTDGTRRIEAELIDEHGQATSRRSLATATLARFAPATPTGLTVSASPGQPATLTWNPGSGPSPASYQVEVDGTTVATLAGQTTTYTVPAPQSLTVQTIRLTALDASGRRSLPTAPALIRH